MKLRAYLHGRGLEPRAFATELGVAYETVRRYIAGTRTPDHATMRRIIELTGGAVTPNDFFEIDQLVPAHAALNSAPAALPAPDKACSSRRPL